MMAMLMGLKVLAPAALQAAIAQGGVHVVDVNALHSWQKARIPGAQHLDPGQFDVAQLPPDKSRALVFYCSNPFCRKAPLAARRAKAMGYGDVRVLSAGIVGWIKAGLPVEHS